MTVIRVLHVDDSVHDRGLVRHALEVENQGFELTAAASRADFETALARCDFDIVLSDFNILGFEGLQVIDAVRAKGCDAPVIIVTGDTGSEAIAVESIRRGAADYVIKSPRHLGRLPHIIQQALEHKRLIEAERAAHAALVHSEQRFRSLTALTSDWYWEQDEQFRFTEHSEGLEKVCGLRRENLLGKARWELDIYPDMTAGKWARHRADLEAKRPFWNFECSMRSERGELRHITISGEPIFDGSGQFKGYRGVGKDITEQRQSEQALASLRKADVRFRIALDNIPDSVVIYDHDLIVQYANERAIALSGTTREQLIGQRTGTHVKEIAAVHLPQLLRTRETKAARSVESEITIDGTSYYFTANYVPLLDERGEIHQIVCIAHDITERRKFEDRLAVLAQYDSLTSLPNRNLLRDRLMLALARAKRQGSLLGVIFFDLDRFKEINDSFGHLAGDRVLQGVAQRLREHLREIDTLARLGGDEFTVLVENALDKAQIGVVAQKIRDGLAEPVTVDGHEFFITPSIGISVCPDDGDNADDLLKKADIAMYSAKREGGNTAEFYAQKMDAKSTQEMTLQHRLRRALEREEFVLHYQPQIAIKSSSLTGMEALIRWDHPEIGLVYPLQFIRLAEDTGLIVPIGEWVLHSACAQYRIWRDAGYAPRTLSINVSARQFREKNFTTMIDGALAEWAMQPASLELELTESMLVQNAEDTIAKMEELHELGVRLAIDDFGTGYSSLSYLKRFPLYSLKIDQGFVRNINHDMHDMAITAAVVALARSLGLRTIAEGVENRDQLRLLESLNCHEYQGNYFSQPLPAADVRLPRAAADFAASAPGS